MKELLKGANGVSYWVENPVPAEPIHNDPAITQAEIMDALHFFAKNFEADAKKWEARCIAAEFYIENCPFDPDISKEQFEAYNAWQALKNT